MKTLLRGFFSLIAAGAILLGTSSCVTNEGPQPPRERISSLPQNLPQSWEGQSQLGGMPTSY